MDSGAQLPDPTKFGRTREDLEQLGRAFLNALKQLVAESSGKQSWDELPKFAQAVALAQLSLPEYEAGVTVFYNEAQRCAAEGKFYLAGKHYRSWYNLGFAKYLGFNFPPGGPIARQTASIRANAVKRATASEKALRIHQEGLKILRARRTSPSQNELARLIGEKLGIPRETVRRYIKRSPFPEALRKRKHSA